MLLDKKFVLHDEGLNDYGTRVITLGIRMKRFRDNSVMFYDHRTWEMPIGHWENIILENGRILAQPNIDEKDPRGPGIIEKVNNGDIKGASMAFDVITMSSDPLYVLPGQRFESVIEAEAIEASLTPLPGNKACLILRRGESVLQLSGGKDQDAANFLNPLKLETDMKKIALKLKLKEDATEDEICTQLDQLALSATRVETMQNHFIELGRSMLPDGEGQNMFSELAKSNPEQAVKFLKLQRKEGDDKPIVERISEMLKLGKPATQGTEGEPKEPTFDELQKKDPARLLNLKRSDPVKFAKLVADHLASKKQS